METETYTMSAGNKDMTQIRAFVDSELYLATVTHEDQLAVLIPDNLNKQDKSKLAHGLCCGMILNSDVAEIVNEARSLFTNNRNRFKVNKSSK